MITAKGQQGMAKHRIRNEFFWNFENGLPYSHEYSDLDEATLQELIGEQTDITDE